MSKRERRVSVDVVITDAVVAAADVAVVMIVTDVIASSRMREMTSMMIARLVSSAILTKRKESLAEADDVAVTVNVAETVMVKSAVGAEIAAIEEIVETEEVEASAEIEVIVESVPLRDVNASLASRSL
jgi:hypothetical protein